MWTQTVKTFKTDIIGSWEKELFSSTMYPSNKTIDWVDTDIPQNKIDDRKISYTFNSHGFRSDEFLHKSEINILTNGCSITVGVGVDQQHTWPFVLKKLIEQTGRTVSIWNLALSGASPDYVVRSTYKVIDILSPDFTFVHWPPATRLEAPSDYSHQLDQTFISSNKFPKTFVNDIWLDRYLMQKNINFIKEICKNSYFADNPLGSISKELQTIFYADSMARDGQHPGEQWHKGVAGYFFKVFLDKYKCS